MSASISCFSSSVKEAVSRCCSLTREQWQMRKGLRKWGEGLKLKGFGEGFRCKWRWSEGGHALRFFNAPTSAITNFPFDWEAKDYSFFFQFYFYEQWVSFRRYRVTRGLVFHLPRGVIYQLPLLCMAPDVFRGSIGSLFGVFPSSSSGRYKYRTTVQPDWLIMVLVARNDYQSTNPL